MLLLPRDRGMGGSASGVIGDMIQNQSHDKFKVYITQPGSDGLITPALQGFVRSFASEHAVKSVGVEYIEAKGQLVLSLGYRDDQTGYPVSLHSVSIGKPETEADIAKAMSDAAGKVTGDVICHDKAEYVLVLLVHG